ncbi:hypothetical protein JAAARDRAFT_40793 [Jaapia argillacea MUCL 33604]|uniref:Carboxypeptidase n=1 Tax=Jaapia argillacea MUCL 33604 TaxID=933084 RepID=A0A067PN67_9AGAM|nr:hypothetical protein JAAARDRAFT_40793 [Jaapia argillacea MUCL 33604]
MLPQILTSFLALTLITEGQTLDSPIPNTWPQNYSGIPSSSYSPEWQAYYEVTRPLPNVTFPLSRSFAGNMAVNRPGHPNDTLFFWGFEKDAGSLTAPAGDRVDEPWLIWLNGGPGSSSLLGLFLENGPLHVADDYSIVRNNYSWDGLTDTIWVDQPVGTGFATADSDGGYIADEDHMAEDFLGFLSNLVSVFPSLKVRPLYLTGESYCGVYIPYITKALFSASDPPIKLRKVAIGNGAIGSLPVSEDLPILTVIETYPQLINYDPDVYDCFKTLHHLCGYDLNLTYPQDGYFPTVPLYQNPEPTATFTSSPLIYSPGGPTRRKDSWAGMFSKRYAEKVGRGEIAKMDIGGDKGRDWKREISGRPNRTIDPWYGCHLWDEMVDYAVNYSFPWNLSGVFNPYFIPDALNTEAHQDPSVFLNDPQTRAALHAPTSKNWTGTFDYPFGSTYNFSEGSNRFGDPSLEPMAFLTELAMNASIRSVAMIFYSGNDDSLVAHRGTEVVIQNTTFGGFQGFTRRPSTPWCKDNGEFAGIIHQERNVTYALFAGAGHAVPQQQPESAYVFLREFILGSNPTGLVLNTTRGSSVVGGENRLLAEDVLPGVDAIFYGSGRTASSAVAPSATIDRWQSFITTAAATASSWWADLDGG